MFVCLFVCLFVCSCAQLNGFVDRYFDEIKGQGAYAPQETSGEPSAGGGEGHQPMKSPLMLIEGFLQALTNVDTNGRIAITKKGTFYCQCPVFPLPLALLSSSSSSLSSAIDLLWLLFHSLSLSHLIDSYCGDLFACLFTNFFTYLYAC